MVRAVPNGGSHCAKTAGQVTPQAALNNCEPGRQTAITTLLLTRPAEANARFLALLSEECQRRVQVIENPLLAIRGLDGARDATVTEAGGAVFSSANGVRFASTGAGRPAYCVGEHTTAMARRAGWQAVCAGQDADGLVAFLEERSPRPSLVHFCGEHQRGDIAERLQAVGWTVARQVVYAQDLLPLSATSGQALRTGQEVLVPLFSPRTAAHFGRICEKSAEIMPIALSQAVADALPDHLKACTRIAPEPTLEAMAGAVAKRIAEISPG